MPLLVIVHEVSRPIYGVFVVLARARLWPLTSVTIAGDTSAGMDLLNKPAIDTG